MGQVIKGFSNSLFSNGYRMEVDRVEGGTKVINHLRGKLRNDIKSGGRGVSEGCLSLRTNSCRWERANCRKDRKYRRPR